MTKIRIDMNEILNETKIKMCMLKKEGKFSEVLNDVSVVIFMLQFLFGDHISIRSLAV